MTCDELLDKARKGRPSVRYTRNHKGTAIAAWVESEGRWATVAGAGIDGKWYGIGDLIVDGEPVHKQADWIMPA